MLQMFTRLLVMLLHSLLNHRIVCFGYGFLGHEMLSMLSEVAVAWMFFHPLQHSAYRLNAGLCGGTRCPLKLELIWLIFLLIDTGRAHVRRHTYDQRVRRHYRRAGLSAPLPSLRYGCVESAWGQSRSCDAPLASRCKDGGGGSRPDRRSRITGGAYFAPSCGDLAFVFCCRQLAGGPRLSSDASLIVQLGL